MKLAESRYRAINDLHIFLHENPDIDRALSDEILNSAAYTEQVIAQYQHKNLHEFAAFNIPTSTLNELDAIVSADWYLSHKRIFDQVENFKTKLGFDMET